MHGLTNHRLCSTVVFTTEGKKNWLVSGQVQFKPVLFKGQLHFHFLAYVCLGYWELLQLAPMPPCAPIIVELCFFGGFVLLLAPPYFLSQDAPGSSCVFPVPVLELGHFYGKWYWKPIPEYIGRTDAEAEAPKLANR